jgi:hypothetical protein
VITSHTVQVPRRPVAPDHLSPFRFGTLGDRVILTTDHGQWHTLDQGAFRALLAGPLESGHPEREALAAKGFLRDQTSLDDVAALVRARKRFVGAGPTHHRILLTSADGSRHLSVETAKDILDLVMLSSSAALDLELIAPAGAWSQDLVAFIVQYTTEKNRYEGKALTWRLRADLRTLPDGAGVWLVDKRFQVRTDLHGAAAHHDPAGGADHATVTAHIAALHAAAAAKGKADWRVLADVAVTTHNVHDPAAVVAALQAAGVRSFRARPRLTGEGAITAADFACFYAGLTDALLTTSDLVEEAGAFVLARALRTDAAPDVENRSPGGFGTGQLVYDADGRVFPSLLAASLHDEGDDLFLVGKAGETSYKECLGHPTLRTLAVASLLECLPGFADHWATPFCGADPVADYAATGDLFPKLPTSASAAASRAIAEALIGRLATADAATTASLERWSR